MQRAPERFAAANLLISTVDKRNYTVAPAAGFCGKNDEAELRTGGFPDLSDRCTCGPQRRHLTETELCQLLALAGIGEEGLLNMRSPTHGVCSK